MGKRVNRLISSQRGFTLAELMVAIAIMAILTAIATLAFRQMQVKADIEAQAQELFVDLAKVRSDALFQKADRSVKLTGANEITVYATSDGTGAPIWQKTYLKNKGITSGDTVTLAFDASGVASSNKAFCVGPAGNGAGVDGIAIYSTSITLGKWNGGTCTSGNIDPK